MLDRNHNGSAAREIFYGARVGETVGSGVGTESKFFNAIEFYDHVEGIQSFGTHG